jgi:hypothetical protein
MSDDDDIPVLRDAVARRPRGLSPEQIDELIDSLSAETWVLIDKLVTESLKEAEEALLVRINDRLSDELPSLIEKTVREQLEEDAN